MKRLWSLVGTYVFYCGRPSCPVNARRSLLNGPEDFGAVRAKPQPLRFGGLADFLFDTFPPLGISTTLIHGGRPGLHNIQCLSSDFFLYRGLCVPRHQKHLLYAELLQEDFRVVFSPHLPLPFSSGSFCRSHSAKQIFCSLATCRSLCQAVKWIPGASGTVVLLGGDCG